MRVRLGLAGVTIVISAFKADFDLQLMLQGAGLAGLWTLSLSSETGMADRLGLAGSKGDASGPGEGLCGDRSDLEQFAKMLPPDIIFHFDPDPKWGNRPPFVPRPLKRHSGGQQKIRMLSGPFAVLR
jgi:hypothetical protein